MKKISLDFSKCKTKIGTGLEYDLMLLSEKGMPIISVFVHRNTDISKQQKKTVMKELRKTLEAFVQQSIEEKRLKAEHITRHIDLYEDENYKPFEDPDYERTY